jgi:hypothetical protein
MRFYFPDTQDQIDPNFDFDLEEHPLHHVRQRDDHYPHEALREPVSTGILVSMGVARYTMAQQHRLKRLGIREFFRLDVVEGPRIETLGDCGAFSYVNEPEPPCSVAEVLEFYEGCGFDAGVSIDHVVAGYKEEYDQSFPGFDGVPPDWRRRQEITLELAQEFLKEHSAQACRFQPIGAAQGWSPASYAHSVSELQSMGYRRIGLGGLVSLKSHKILRALQAIDDVREAGVEFHLFGVTRTEHVLEFQKYGVTSIDSTSPFRQAFKDDKDNYYAPDKNYVALRIPQVERNPGLKRLIAAGKVDQEEARRLERASIDVVRGCADGNVSVKEAVRVLREYELLYGSNRDHSAAYAETLTDRPWEECSCAICEQVGVEVVIFRGSERNKRRGFHNLHVFNQKLKAELGVSSLEEV